MDKDKLVELNIKNRRRNRGTMDSLEYLKYALINCRRTRMELQRQKESPVPKIQTTSQNGFTFSYSVTESINGLQQDNAGDSSDEESDSDSEDEIHDYLSATAETAETTQQNSKIAETMPEFSCKYLDYTLPKSITAELKTDVGNPSTSYPTSYEEFVKSLDSTATFISYEHFFSALHEKSSQFENVIQQKSAENEISVVTYNGDTLMSGKEFEPQKIPTNTDSAIDEVLNLLDGTNKLNSVKFTQNHAPLEDTTKMNSVKFTENYTLTYLESATDSNYIELHSAKSSLETISMSDLENLNLENSEEPKKIVSATESILQQCSMSDLENLNLANSAEPQKIVSATESILQQFSMSDLEKLNLANSAEPQKNISATESILQQCSMSDLGNLNLENSAKPQKNISATESILQQCSEMPQEFSCDYLDFLNCLAENHEEDSAKSIKVEESEKSFIDSALLFSSESSVEPPKSIKVEESEKSFIDSALLFSSESSVEPHYSKYFFSPEEIEEFSNQFDLHTQIT